MAIEFKVLSVLKKFMTEEQYEAFKEKGTEFEKEVNKDIAGYITSNTPNKDDLVAEARETAVSEVIKGLAISDVDTIDKLKAHIAVVNSNTTEKDTTITRLTSELEAEKSKFSELETNFNTLTKQTNETTVESKLTSAGFNKAFIEDLKLVALSKKTDDNDFDSIIANMKTDTHKHYLSDGSFGSSLPGDDNEGNVEITEEEMASWMAEAGVDTEKK